MQTWARKSSAGAEFEGGEHLAERAAAGPEHDAGACRHHADARRLRGECLPLPVDADAGQEIIRRRRRFGELLVAAVAVEADGRGRDEHGRLVRGLRDALHEMTRAKDTAVANPRLLGGGPPALGHRLAGQVEDDVDPVERLGGRRPLLRIPAYDPPGQVADDVSRTIGIAGDDHGPIEQPQEPGPDESCGTGDESGHRRVPLRCGERVVSDVWEAGQRPTRYGQPATIRPSRRGV
jgi:hypothetical protein